MTISIIIAIRDGAPWMRRSLESVLRQTKGEFEAIIVDDGSTDGSYQIASEYCADPRMRLYRLEDNRLGPAPVRNFGIGQAHNEWIAFLDADDEWMPDYLSGAERLSERFPEAGLLSCGYQICREDERSPNPYMRAFASRGDHTYDLDWVIRQIRMVRYPFWLGATMVTRSVLEAIGRFRVEACRRGSDTDAWLRAMAITTGAWRAAIGALYYKGIPNQITGTQQCGLEFCEKTTISQMIAEADSAGNRRRGDDLRRLWNFLYRVRLINRFRAGIGTGWDVRKLYTSFDPIYALLFVILLSIPRVLRRPVDRLTDYYRSLRQRK